MANSEKVICNEQVFREVAEELGLDVKIVREVFKMNSLFTKKIMEGNTFDQVRWPYWGVFKVKPKIVQITSHMKGLDKNAQKLFRQQLRNGEIYGNGKKKNS